MNTDSNINGGDLTQGGQDMANSLTSAHGSATAAVFGEQPGRIQPAVVVWPQFQIGADGRVYA